QQFQLTINTLGRLTDPEQFADIIVKGRQPPSATPPAQASPDGSSASDMLTRPTAQSTGIVRLRDVVRENRYYVLIQFDADKLANRKLRPADVVGAMNPQPRSIHEDPEFPTPGVEPLIWLAIYGGADTPLEEDLARTRVAVNGREYRLGDLVTSADGFQRLEDRDELGVVLGSQQYDQSCTLNGQPSVALSIYQLPGSNALQTAKGVYAKMREL